MLQSDARTPDVPRTQSLEDGTRYYFKNGWHLRDTRGQGGVELLRKGHPVIIDQDFMTPDALKQDPFYNECLVPIGMPWFAGIGFKAGSALWGLTCQRRNQDGPFEFEDKAKLAFLSPRLTEVATLSTAIGRAAIGSATNVLGLVDKPAVAIDRKGLVISVNELANNLFDDEFFLHNRRFVIADRDSRQRFDSAVASLASDVPEKPLAAAIVIRHSRMPPLSGDILPVPDAARTPFLGARAIIVFKQPGRRRAPDQAEMRKLFGFTQAEAELAALLAVGLSLEEAGHRLGISKHTARAQLKAIFAKTHSHRQGELIALLGAL